jgi:hypothetical protein
MVSPGFVCALSTVIYFSLAMPIYQIEAQHYNMTENRLSAGCRGSIPPAIYHYVFHLTPP